MDEGGLQRAALDAFGGAVAGGVSRTVVSPLDVIKIRFQVQLEPTRRLRSLGVSQVASKYTGILQATRDIVREEGLSGLWRGNVPALLLGMHYTAIQFVVLQKFKKLAAEHGPAGGTVAKMRNPPLIQLYAVCALYKGESGLLSRSMPYVSGSIAGAAATIGSYPFDLLRTILASQGEPKVYNNMRSACVGIIQHRGFRGLYAGLLPSLVEIIPYAGLQFGIYDTLKRSTRVWMQENGLENILKSETFPSVEQFFCGLVAGTFAKLCCHPLDVVKKRFQVEGLPRDLKYGARIERKAYKGMVDAVRRIVEKEGLRGLYKGTMPSVVKAAPATAITFVVYEYVLKLGLTSFGDSTASSE